jgi:hypothetical protein
MRALTCLIVDLHHMHSKLSGWIIAASLTGIHSAQCGGEVPFLCQQELHTQGILSIPTGENLENSNVSHAAGPSVPILQSR